MARNSEILGRFRECIILSLIINKNTSDTPVQMAVGRSRFLGIRVVVSSGIEES